ncbi:MAG: GTP-binding protein [Phaeodactylibacter sp.]|nr:GTP-binding protein [Phaeodactylibacter sp.]MCB9295381.1 GTP-binding protein [Lewinellaceae bacterium]
MAIKKILITGNHAVGKTSLLNRFIHDTFSERPPVNIGLGVARKEIEVQEGPLVLVLWDLVGELSGGKVPRTYLLGASAAVYVFDLSRPDSRNSMEADLAVIRRMLPGCLVRVVGNKKDLLNQAELQALAGETPDRRYASAKTGENVEDIFLGIGRELLGARQEE